MNESPYEPAKSTLIKKRDTYRLKDIASSGFDRVMLFSLLFVAAFDGLFYVISLIDFDLLELPAPGQLELSDLLLEYVLGFLMTAFNVYLIRQLRGNVIRSNKTDIPDRYLSVWGYFWRTVIAKYVAFLIVLVAMVSTGLSKEFEMPSIEFTIAYNVLLVPVAVFVVWLLFSYRKKQQLNWVLSVFRGY
jgi:hypothetical protein